MQGMLLCLENITTLLIGLKQIPRDFYPISSCVLSYFVRRIRWSSSCGKKCDAESFEWKYWKFSSNFKEEKQRKDSLNCSWWVFQKWGFFLFKEKPNIDEFAKENIWPEVFLRRIYIVLLFTSICVMIRVDLYYVIRFLLPIVNCCISLFLFWLAFVFISFTLDILTTYKGSSQEMDSCRPQSISSYDWRTVFFRKSTWNVTSCKLENYTKISKLSGRKSGFLKYIWVTCCFVYIGGKFGWSIITSSKRKVCPSSWFYIIEYHGSYIKRRYQKWTITFEWFTGENMNEKDLKITVKTTNVYIQSSAKHTSWSITMSEWVSYESWLKNKLDFGKPFIQIYELIPCIKRGLKS